MTVPNLQSVRAELLKGAPEQQTESKHPDNWQEEVYKRIYINDQLIYALTQLVEEQRSEFERLRDDLELNNSRQIRWMKSGFFVQLQRGLNALTELFFTVLIFCKTQIVAAMCFAKRTPRLCYKALPSAASNYWKPALTSIFVVSTIALSVFLVTQDSPSNL